MEDGGPVDVCEREGASECMSVLVYSDIHTHIGCVGCGCLSGCTNTNKVCGKCVCVFACGCVYVYIYRTLNAYTNGFV